MTWEQIVSLVGSPIIAAVVSWWLNRDLKDELRAQGRELAELKDRRVTKVEMTVDQHLSGDQSQTLLTELRHVSAQLTGVTQRLDLAREEIAALKAQRASDLGYLENVNRSLQAHKDGHGHA